MAKQVIDIGSQVDDEAADSVRDSFNKVNDNFTELYTGLETAESDINTAEQNISTLQGDVNALEIVEENPQIVSYTLVLTDNLKLVTVTNANACTLTVPPNSQVSFPVGAVIAVCQGGAGVLTIVEGSGVTINSADSAKKLTGQWATASLIKTATDTWLLSGSISA
jgi:prophage DNA circulation protein